MTRWLRLGILPLVALAASACDSSRSPMSPTPVTAVVTADLLAALDLGIQDEYRAEAIYQGVVNDFGPVLPFTAVLTAELRHSTSIAQLYAKRGLPAPVSQSSMSTVPHFATVREACAAAVVAERENIALYDRLLAGDLPDDVRQVFSNNRRASLDNHLPAFVACS
jgi:hypothetical protein